MNHKCGFSLWSRGQDSSFAEDVAFSCYAQACEGDFTVGRGKLDEVAAILADNWVCEGVNPNDPIEYRAVCESVGFNYDDLLDEEIDYLAMKVEEEIRRNEM